MKKLLLAIVFIGLAGTFAYHVLQPVGDRRAALPQVGKAAVPPAMPAAPATPATGARAKAATPAAGPAKITHWREDELVLIRGRVQQVLPQGVLVEIDVPADEKESVQVPIYARTREHQRMAGVILQNEHKEYGPALMTHSGALRPARAIPERKAVGVVMLADHPQAAGFRAGQRIKVLAAPQELPFTHEESSGSRLTVSAYTMNYIATAPAAEPPPKSRTAAPLDQGAIQ